jgi:dTDP-4-dehydrorhamnose reductase
MKILVTGVNGQLGYDVIRELRRRGVGHIGVGRAEFDITDYAATKQYIRAYHPDAVMHCGAYTAVDKAEDEPQLCREVNACGTEYIASICRDIGAKMVYISTDYVFPGTGTTGYEVTDETRPLNTYGLTKWEGEEAVRKCLERYFIVRISWVFGRHGNNFVKTMLRLGTERKELNVVSDQVGSPTYTVDAASFLCDLVMTENYGTYHATNEGVCSWAAFAEEIFRQAHLDCHIHPITTAQYPTKAKRPLNSRLSKRSLDQQGFPRLPDWHDALRRYLIEMREKNKYRLPDKKRSCNSITDFILKEDTYQ